LRSDSSHLLFIDSDIHFDPQDVLALIALDKDVIGAPYPKKSINWKNIAAALVKDPTTPVNELDNLVGDYVFNPVPGTTQFNVREPLEVMEIGTGFMMVKREVFEKLRMPIRSRTTSQIMLVRPTLMVLATFTHILIL